MFEKKTTPIILLTFANDADDPLCGLAEEHDALQEILKIPQREGKCKVIALTATTPDKLIRVFQEYQHRIRIFHYAGHSDQDAIFLGKDYPGQSATQATDLAGFLALQGGLELVFLNSCLSMGQAAAHQEAGIPAVLATKVKINDTTAVNFAKKFYQGIAGGATLTEAYQQADRGMQITDDTDSRGQGLPPTSGTLPWQLFPEKDHTWRLPLVAKRLTKLPSLELQKEFFGREEDLKRLVKKLETSTKVVLMNGLGGIGKTVLATAYTQTQQQHYDHIAWINRGEDLINSFALNGDLAETLGMPIEKEEPPQERFSRILHKMSNLPGNNLLVIDNAQQQVAQKEIFDLLPGHPNWRVLLTSRLDLQQFDPIRLDTLGAEAARKLFQEHYQGKYTAAELDELLEEIGYHTLTVELLARLLSRLNNLLSISELTTILQKKELNNSELQELIYSKHSGAEHGIYMHLMKAFELTNLSEDEIWLLKQFIVLPIEQYPVTKLAELLDQRPLYLNKILNSLAGKGWLTKHEDNSFSIHRLIRQITEYKLKPKYDDLEALVKNLTIALYKDDFGNSVIDNFPWVKYANNIINYLNGFEKFEVSVLQNNLGLVLHDLGNYADAKRLIEMVSKSFERYLGPQDEGTILSYSNLAFTLKELGDHLGAKILLEKVLKFNEAKFGPADPKTAQAYSNMATVVQELGDYHKAKKLLEQAIKVDEVNLGPNHPTTSIRYSNLASVLQDLGDYPRAKESLEKAIKSDEKNFGPNHSTTLIKYSNLATLLKETGDPLQAKKLLEKVMAYEDANFESDHPARSSTYSLLAIVLHDLGDYPEAKKILEKAIDIDTANFGRNNPRTAVRLSNLATILQREGDYQKAEELLKEALKSYELYLRPNHPSISASYYNLAILYRDLEDYPKAKETFEKVIELDSTNYGASHPSTAKSYLKLAELLIILGDYIDAKKLLQKALKIFTDRLGPDHPHTKIVKQHLDNLPK